jgi:hypothetical protein
LLDGVHVGLRAGRIQGISERLPAADDLVARMPQAGKLAFLWQSGTLYTAIRSVPIATRI